MYSFLVHVVRPSAIDWRINTPDGAVIVANKEVVEVKSSLHNSGEEAEMETWYARDEATANALAKHLSSQKPNTDVYVLKTIGIAKSIPQKPTMSAVTDKGVVPR